jgi:hypothetical protein
MVTADTGGTMATTLQPRFGELSAEESATLLREHTVGRIAYSWRDHVDIEPIHYVYDGHAIFGRTSAGAKLLTLRHSPWVAFEVDEVRGAYDWRSVVAHGTVYVLRPDGSPTDRRLYQRALALLRTVEPAALTDDDPAPWRHVLFQLGVDRLSGRESWGGERAGT